MEIYSKALGIKTTAEQATNRYADVFEQGRRVSSQVLKILDKTRESRKEENEKLEETMTHKKRSIVMRKELAGIRKAKSKLLQPVAIKETVIQSSVHPDRQEYIQEYESKNVRHESKEKLVGKVILDAKTYAKAAGWEKIQWPGTLLCIGKKEMRK